MDRRARQGIVVSSVVCFSKIIVTVNMKIRVFCDMTPCSYVDGYRRISEESAT
jgi:hypothetical protein